MRKGRLFLSDGSGWGGPTRRLAGLEGGVFLAAFTMGGGSQGGVVQSQTLIIELLSSSSLFTPCEPCSLTEPQFPCLSVLMIIGSVPVVSPNCEV